AERLRDIAHAVAEPAHHLAEHAPQTFLLAGGFAHLPGLIAVLAIAGLLLSLLPALLLSRLLPLLPAGLLAVAVRPAGLALGAEAAVEQLLLSLHHLVQATHHLLRLARAALAVAGAGGAQVFQH